MTLLSYVFSALQHLPALMASLRPMWSGTGQHYQGRTMVFDNVDPRQAERTLDAPSELLRLLIHLRSRRDTS